MRVELENYEASRHLVPGLGQQIVAHQTEDELIAYQAYKPSIADHAVASQQLGGNDFSYDRMSWI